MASFSWLASEMLTGRVFADLRDLDVPSVKYTIGRYETASGTLPLVGDAVPQDWERVLLPGATCFHLMRRTPGGVPVPQWGGYITADPLTEADSVEFPMSTIEGYFDRRFVGDELYEGVGQNLIVKDLVEKYAADGPNGGIPIRVEILGGIGTPRDREYKDQDDKTLYSVLQDFMGVQGGPEWTVGQEYSIIDGQPFVKWVLYVGDRIGTAVTPDLQPAAVFEMPGSVRSFLRHRSYEDGKGANVVMAVSSGAGDARPQSAPVVTPDTVRPTFEYRFTPSTSIKDTLTLDEHAQAAAVELADGTKSLQMDADAVTAPTLNVDWFIGDDIGFKIGGQTRPGASNVGAPGVLEVDSDGLVVPAPDMVDAEDGLLTSGSLTLGALGLYEFTESRRKKARPVVPAFPTGLRGVARAIGVEIELSGVPRITPILAGDDVK